MGPSLVDAPVAPPPRLACRHCGSPPIERRGKETDFCCEGCSYVFRLVHEHGLDAYYRFKDEVTAPADSAVFQARDTTWLRDAQRAAESAAGTEPAAEMTLSLQGVSCAACVWLIERIFGQQPGGRRVVANVQYGTIRLRWTIGEFSADTLAHKLQSFGYTMGPVGETVDEPESRTLVKRMGLCAAFTMNVMLFSLPSYFGMTSTDEWAGLFALLNVVFGTLSMLVGGTYFIERAARALHARTVHIDLPISIGFLGAYLGSIYGWMSGHEEFVYFDFVSAFILLMLIGRWSQVAAVEHNRRRLLSGRPQTQPIRLASGASISPETIQAGMAYSLLSGQVNPVEARLDTAGGSFSLASINGEEEPRLFRVGQRVPSGAASLNRAAVSLHALQPWRESLLAQLLETNERSPERRSFLDLIVRSYLVGILAIAVVSGLVWWFTTHDALRTGAVVTAVLVVSCPCAIALAFPLTDEFATVALRKRGVYVRDSTLWSRLGRVRQVVFDKTGTLTLETPVLRNPEALESLTTPERSALVALIHDSAHPIGQSLLQTLLARGALPTSSAEVAETPGRGVESGAWSLGDPGWRTPNDDEGGTIFARSGKRIARFHFVDVPRPNAKSELAALRRRGLSVAILSGDRKKKVESLAEALGLSSEHAHGGFDPQQKADWLTRHTCNDALMLGDGANDSLAFDRALCRGTPVIHRGVLERKADFYYLGNGIGGIRALFEIDAVRRRTQHVVLVFSVLYNLVTVSLAVTGQVNPLVAAILMPINSLLTLSLVLLSMRRVFGRSQAASEPT